MTESANPYEPPRAPLGSGRPPPTATPGVWTAYVIYCVLMALMYLGLCALGIVFFAIIPGDPDFYEEGMGSAEIAIILVLTVGIGLFFCIPYAAAPFLPKRPWTWYLGIGLIGIGLTSCLTLPFCIPLLIYWLKPECQAFFGRAVAPGRIV